MMYDIHFINRWQKWQFYRMRRRRALYKNIKHRSFEMCLKTKLSTIQVFVNMLINKTRWLLLLASTTSFAVKLVLKTKRVKRRMVGVIEQDVHADLCHCDVCLARQRNFRDKYSPAKTSDNHATVKKIAAVTYKVKQDLSNKENNMRGSQGKSFWKGNKWQSKRVESYGVKNIWKVFQFH